MFETIMKKARICAEQNEILRVRIFIPSSAEYLKISSFYEVLAQRTMDFCSGSIGETARQSYEKSRESAAPFNKYFYSLVCVPAFVNLHVAVIDLRAELKCGSAVIEEFSDTQWWELESEKMIPPRIALKEHFEWQKTFGKIRRKTCVFLSGRRVFANIREKRTYVGDLMEKSQ